MKEFINSEDIYDDKLKINMILSKNLSNFSQIFENRTKLIKLSIDNDIKKLDNEFNDFEQIQKFNYFNVNNNEDISSKDFYSSELSDISEKTEIKNLNVYQLFDDFQRLPDISELNNNIVTDIRKMFSNCIS